MHAAPLWEERKLCEHLDLPTSESPGLRTSKAAYFGSRYSDGWQGSQCTSWLTVGYFVLAGVKEVGQKLPDHQGELREGVY